MATKNFVPRADGEGALGKASKRWGKFIGNDIDIPFLNARISGAAYAVGDKVNAPYYTDYYLLCQTAGTTSTTTITKAQMTAAIIAGTLTDGTVTWGTYYNAFNNIAENHNNFLDIREVSAEKLSAQIQDGTFRDSYPGNYFVKSAMIEGTAYNLKYMLADIMPFGSTSNSGYATITDKHAGLVVFNLPRHVMNSTDTTVGGYYNSEMHQWLESEVLPAIETALGASHIIQHKKLLSTGMDSTRCNRYGQATGAASNRDWKDSKISLLSEAQVYGGTVWSSSGFDTGEAFKQLALFRHVRPQKIQYENFWLRDLASASLFAYSYRAGVALGNVASAADVAPLPLILYH